MLFDIKVLLEGLRFAEKLVGELSNCVLLKVANYQKCFLHYFPAFD